MAENRKQESEAGMLGRLAERGEDALTRVMDELGRNPRVTDALGRAMSAKGRVDETTRKTLGTVGLAAADEIKDLRAQLERLETRLAKLETGAAAPTRGGKAGRASATTTKSSGGTARRSAPGAATKPSPGAGTKSGGTTPRPRRGGTDPAGPTGPSGPTGSP